MIRVLFLWALLVLAFPHFVNAKSNSANDPIYKTQVEESKILPVEIVSGRVREDYPFYGLASYYNNIQYFIIDRDSLRKIDEGDLIELHQNQWLAVVGRLDVLLVRATGLMLTRDKSNLVIYNTEILSKPDTIIEVVTKPALPSIAPELDQLRYSHLWGIFAWIAKLAESSLVAIQANIVSNWGLTIVVFSILLKLLFLPISVMTVHLQRGVSRVQAQLAPQLAEIKVNYDGEEAHYRLMDAHRRLGVSPFYTLRPMLGTLIQIPILIAVFNALGEMPQLDDQSFLWIENLAYPDSVGNLPFVVPMFGSTISLLPFIMTTVAIYSTAVFKNRHSSDAELERQKRNLYMMAAAFFILFYPFPAAMVLYWTLSNLLHLIQQQIVRV